MTLLKEEKRARKPVQRTEENAPARNASRSTTPRRQSRSRAAKPTSSLIDLSDEENSIDDPLPTDRITPTNYQPIHSISSDTSEDEQEDVVDCWYFTVDGEQKVVHINATTNPLAAWRFVKEARTKNPFVFTKAITDATITLQKGKVDENTSLFVYSDDKLSDQKNEAASNFAQTELFGNKLVVLVKNATNEIEPIQLLKREANIKWENTLQRLDNEERVTREIQASPLQITPKKVSRAQTTRRVQQNKDKSDEDKIEDRMDIDTPVQQQQQQQQQLDNNLLDTNEDTPNNNNNDNDFGNCRCGAKDDPQHIINFAKLMITKNGGKIKREFLSGAVGVYHSEAAWTRFLNELTPNFRIDKSLIKYIENPTVKKTPVRRKSTTTTTTTTRRTAKTKPPPLEVNKLLPVTVIDPSSAEVVPKSILPVPKNIEISPTKKKTLTKNSNIITRSDDGDSEKGNDPTLTATISESKTPVRKKPRRVLDSDEDEFVFEEDVAMAAEYDEDLQIIDKPASTPTKSTAKITKPTSRLTPRKAINNSSNSSSSSGSTKDIDEETIESGKASFKFFGGVSKPRTAASTTTAKSSSSASASASSASLVSPRSNPKRLTRPSAQESALAELRTRPTKRLKTRYSESIDDDFVERSPPVRARTTSRKRAVMKTAPATTSTAPTTPTTAIHFAPDRRNVTTFTRETLLEFENITRDNDEMLRNFADINSTFQNFLLSSATIIDNISEHLVKKHTGPPPQPLAPFYFPNTSSNDFLIEKAKRVLERMVVATQSLEEM